MYLLIFKCTKLLNDNPNMKQVFCGLAYKTNTHKIKSAVDCSSKPKSANTAVDKAL